MKTNRMTTTFTAGALVLAIVSSIYGEEKTAASATVASPKAAAPSAGLANDWLREQNQAFTPWDIGGQVRTRYEVKEDGGSFPARDFRKTGVDNDNSYLLLREKVHLGYNAPWFSAYVEARDSSTTGDDRNPNPEADPFDLHQAFVTVGNAKQFPLTAKVGRQELVYGDERLIGNGDWNNLGRVFDAAKLRYEDKNLWVDAFSGRVGLANDGRFNVANDYDWFSGVYASTRTLVPKQETQVYVLARNTGAGSPTATTGSPPAAGPSARDIYSFGLRVKSLPGQWHGWDYAAELAGQLGSVNLGGTRLDHEAFAASVGGGYGHFFVGKYVEQSLAGVGGSTGADWLYVQATFNFQENSRSQAHL